MACLFKKVGVGLVSIRALIFERQVLPVYVQHPSYRGVAWQVRDWEYDWDVAPDVIGCTMVGDDRRFEFDIDDLDVLHWDQFCSGCGQVGCAHGV